MTLPLPSRFDRLDQRLAIGLEPLDAVLTVRGGSPAPAAFPQAPLDEDRPVRLLTPVDAYAEGTPLGITRPVRPPRRRGRELDDMLPALDRREYGRFVLAYAPDLDDRQRVVVRLVDRARRYVPRRLSIPLVVPDSTALPPVDLDDVDASPPARRLRRPFLWPGAAYPVASGATGLRGRVMRAGTPAAWALVTATIPVAPGGAPLVVGRARGDDRGEFLLLIGPAAVGGGTLPLTIALDVTIELPPAPPASPFPLPDPLAELPIELVPTTVGWPRADAVCAWDLELPTTPWPPTATPTLDTRRVDFVPGRVLSSEVAPFAFT